MDISRRTIVGLTIGSLLGGIGAATWWVEPKESMISSYRSNPLLSTISFPDQRTWQGTPVDADGRYVNLHHPFLPKLSELLQWQLSNNPDKEKKKNDTYRPEFFSSKDFLYSSEDCIVWLGHATFFMRLAGRAVLIDPVFGDVHPTPKRLWTPLFSAEDFTSLDYILLSHDHRDHADEPSIRALAAGNPTATYLTGFGVDELLAEWTSSTSIQAAGWYQEFAIEDGLRIVYLPTRHWGRRGLNDTNRRLWGAFFIQTPTTSIYFSGDTGYDVHLPEVKALFGEPDICIIGVGAYKPEWFMGSNHISPTDALRAANEMGAKTMIPMHYATFDLSDEPVGDPAATLDSLEKKGTSTTLLRIAGVGEVISV